MPNWIPKTELPENGQWRESEWLKRIMTHLPPEPGEVPEWMRPSRWLPHINPLLGMEQTFTTLGTILTAPWRARELGELAKEFPAVSPLPGGRGYEQYQQWQDPSIPVGVPSWRQWGGWLGLGERPLKYEMARMGMKETAEFAPFFFMGGGVGKSILEQAAELTTKQVAKGKTIEEATNLAFTQLAKKGRLPKFIPPKTPKPLLPNTPKGTIETPSPDLPRPQALKNVIDEFYTPVWDSPLDASATAYLRNGNFNEFIAKMPTLKGLERLTVEEAQAIGIALKQGGKGAVPALRRSGFYASEEFAAYKNFKDVGYVSGMWQDPTRMVQSIDGGFFGGATQKYVLWPTHRTSLASLRFTDTAKNVFRESLEKYNMVGKKEFRQKAGDVIQHISQAERDLSVKELLKKPDIQKFIKRYPQEVQERIVNFAKETRRTFDGLLDMQNQARLKRNQDAIPYRDNYRPWVIETNIHGRLFGLKKTPADVMQRPPMPDYIKPTAPFNPRAMAREGGMYPYLKERDLQKLVYDYIDVAGKDIFNTNIIHNAKIHAATLRSMGHRNSAALIDDWIAEAYAGVGTRITRGIRAVVPMKVIQPGLWLRRRLTSAVFPLNWTWNAFVQTSSGALTVMRYGVQNSLRGMEYLFNPAVKAEVREKAYSSIIKSRQAGKVAYQDLGASIEKNLKLEGTTLEKGEHYLNILTSFIEEKLTGISVRAAYHDGLQKGLKRGSRELWEYASEGGAKTQSMYNLQDLPGVLRSKEIGALAPFQTFAFEVFNSVRELNIIGIRRIIGRAGAYETMSAKSITGKATTAKRAKMLLEWFASLTAVNVYVDKAINRKPWSSSSFIPFFAVLTGGVNAGNPWNQLLPLKYSQDLKSGIDALIKYGEWQRLRRWAIKYHVPAGLQLNRMLEGLEATLEGKVTDVRGRKLFRVRSEEWWKAIFMGVYTTEEGREYIEKLQKTKGGILYELGGIPIPAKAEEAGWRKWRK